MHARNRQVRQLLLHVSLYVLSLAVTLGSPACECDTLAPEGYATSSTGDTSGDPSTTTTSSESTTWGTSTGDASTGDKSTTNSTLETTTAVSSTSEGSTGPSASCGDGQLDPGEACDDGNDNGENAACTPVCTVNVCGDGFVLDGVEACDDAGESAACNADCTAAACGDAKVNAAANEACDDGNDVAVDGCEATCQRTKLLGISAGEDTTCVIVEGGALKCWGENSRGQLGYGHTNVLGDDEVPSEIGFVDVGGKVTAVGHGHSFMCVLLEDGTIRCWGYGLNGRLGAGNTGGSTCLNGQQKYSCSVKPQCCIGDDEIPSAVAPVDLEGLKATDVVVGSSHVCALVNGSVRCWGDGNLGQLGTGWTAIIGDDEKPYGAVVLGSSVAMIAAGRDHTCAVLVSGGLLCWGIGGGQLGYAENNGDPVGDDEVPSSKPYVKAGGNVLDLALGAYSTCALMDGGGVRCWGDGGIIGNENLLGAGWEPGSMPPADLKLDGDAVEIAAGGTHHCARIVDGTIRCWGSAFGGALGNGSDQGSVGDALGEMPPMAVSLDGEPVMIAAGGQHNCAILKGERLTCWGYNTRGQLGYGHTENIGDQPGEMPTMDVQLFP